MATDYTTGCAGVPLSFIQMLASTIYGYHDIAGVLHYRINGLEVANECTTLSDFLNCNLTHIEPERQLVENTFALDNCGLLAWKIFHNSDTHWTDYANCGETPQTFLQMLARCIVEYAGINRINAVIDEDTCDDIATLFQCSPYPLTDDTAETLLVANAFAVDDCDRLLVKFFANTSAFTDYHTACEAMPLSFMQLLALCVVQYHDHTYINTAVVTGYCPDLHAFWTCANNHIPPERALVENVFATDACGNLALKIFNNGGIRGGGQQ
jgi:hypothetical protein